MDTPGKRLALLAALTGLGACWGATIPLSKIAMSTGHRPIDVIFWQLAISAVVLAPVSVLQRARPRLSRQVLFHFLVIALIGTLLPNSFSLVAVNRLPAGIMAIVIATVPMFALVIALSLRLEGFSPVRMTGVLLGATAVILLITPQTSLPEPDKAIFVLVGLAAAFCYGAEANYLAVRSPPGLDPVVTLLGASIVGTALAAPVAVFSGGFVDLTQPWGRAETAIVAAALFHALAYTGYIWLVGVAGPVFSSQIAYVVTVAGVLISAVLLQESYSGWAWLALAIMICGLALVRPRGSAAVE